MYEFILAATLIFTTDGDDRVRVPITDRFATQALCQARLDKERRAVEQKGLRYVYTVGTVCAQRRVY